MGFLNFWNKKQESVAAINDILPSIDGIDIMFISVDNRLIYRKSDYDKLFLYDKDGDFKLDGRVVDIIYKGRTDKSVIEVFIAFSEDESYALFTMQIGLQERLADLSGSIFTKLAKYDLFSKTDKYATQFVYTFKMYMKDNRFFMVNNGQTAAYIFDDSKVRRGGADEIKKEFWGS